MNSKDRKLMEQLISEMPYPSKDALMEHFMKWQTDVLSGKVTNPKALLLQKNGLPTLGILGPRTIEAVMDLGLVDAYKNGNLKSLHDALYTYSRISLPYHRITIDNDSLSDESLMCKYTVEAFAACDIGSIKKHCPQDSPIVKSGYKMWVVIYNLILGLLYNNKPHLEKGIAQAEKAMKQKIPKFDLAAISYVTALAKQDAQSANEEFGTMMAVYRKSSGLFEFADKFLKVFALLPHGFYNMAYHFLTDEDFASIEPPKETAFWNEFASYQKKMNYTHGEPYISFNGILEPWNSIYK